jgi:uncharacterized membrane protein
VKVITFQSLRNGLLSTLTLIGGLLSISLLLTLLIFNLGALKTINPQAEIAADAFLGSMAAPGWPPLILEGFTRRLKLPGTLLTIGAVLASSFTILYSPYRGEVKNVDQKQKLPAVDTLFVILLIFVGGLLAITPEFIFLRDLFGYRINTIFKFYFQVWLMWGLAAAYAVIFLFRHLAGISKLVFQGVIILLTAISLTYPLMGLWSKTAGFTPTQGYTLDGTEYLSRNNPDEYAAIQWLKNAPLGVVAEAVGGSYTQFARMASNSGQSSVLGWDFHELQWRGGTEETGSRRSDIERLYCTNWWEEAKEIISQYHINYIVIGVMEYTAYGKGSVTCPQGLNESKFIQNLPLAFRQGSTSIYLVPEESESP